MLAYRCFTAGNGEVCNVKGQSEALRQVRENVSHVHPGANHSVFRDNPATLFMKNLFFCNRNVSENMSSTSTHTVHAKVNEAKSRKSWHIVTAGNDETINQTTERPNDKHIFISTLDDAANIPTLVH